MFGYRLLEEEWPKPKQRPFFHVGCSVGHCTLMGDLRHVSTSMEQHTFLSRSHWSAHKHIAIWPYCLHCMTHDIHYVRIGDKTVSVMLFGMSHWRIGKFFLSFLVVLLVLSGRPSVVPSPGHIYHRTDRTFKQQPCALGARSAL